MTTRLPLELIFHIIHFLHNDKIALSACSQCCSALASASKPLLFHTLRTALGSTSAARFEGLLESGPAILSSIKRIEMAISTFQPVVDQRAITAISRVMAYCLRLYTPPQLNLTTRSTRPRPFRFGELITPLDPVVHWTTSLEFDQLDLTEDSIEFWHIILAFPELTSLSLGCVTVGIPSAGIPSHYVSKISHLSLNKSAFGDSCNIRHFLADHPMPLPSLKSLDVRFPTWLDEAAVRLGEQYGMTVRTLRFGVVIACGPATGRGGPACEF